MPIRLRKYIERTVLQWNTQGGDKQELLISKMQFLNEEKPTITGWENRWTELLNCDPQRNPPATYSLKDDDFLVSKWMMDVMLFDPRLKDYMDHLKPFSLKLESCLIFLYEKILYNCGFLRISSHEAEGGFFKQISAEMIGYLEYYLYAYLNNIQSVHNRRRVGMFQYLILIRTIFLSNSNFFVLYDIFVCY